MLEEIFKSPIPIESIQLNQGMPVEKSVEQQAGELSEGEETEDGEEEEDDGDEEVDESLDLKPMIDQHGRLITLVETGEPELVDLTDDSEKRESVKEMVSKIESVEITSKTDESFECKPWDGEEENFWANGSFPELESLLKPSQNPSQGELSQTASQNDPSVRATESESTKMQTSEVEGSMEEEYVMEEYFRRENGVLKTYFVKVKKSERSSLAPVNMYEDISEDENDNDNDNDDNEERYVAMARSEKEKDLLKKFRKNQEKSGSPSKKKGKSKSERFTDDDDDDDEEEERVVSWSVDVCEGRQEKSLSGRGGPRVDPPPYSRETFIHAGFDAVTGQEYFRKVTTLDPDTTAASTSTAAPTGAAAALPGGAASAPLGGAHPPNPPSRRRPHALGDPLVQVFPGLEEVGVGLALKHMTGGPVVGGYPDHTIHRHLSKITMGVNFDKKSTDDEILNYKREERKFMNLVKSGCNAETTIYTLVGLFLQKVQNRYGHVANKLAEKQSYFTSFKHFVREFRVAQWPNIKQHSTLIAVNNKQKAKESIECYFERHVDIMEEAGRDLDDTIEEFISGIYNKKVRETVRLHDYGAVRTLDQVRNFSSKTVQNLEAEKVFNGQDNKGNGYFQPGGKRQKWSKISSATASGSSAGPSAGPSVSSSKGKDASKSKKTHQKSASSAQPKSSKASTQNRQRASAGAPSAAPSAAAVDAGDRHAAAAENEMQKFRLNGCILCLGAKHRHLDGTDVCKKRCPFCSCPLDGQNPHFAILCPKRPNERKQILRKLSDRNRSNNNQNQ